MQTPGHALAGQARKSRRGRFFLLAAALLAGAGTVRAGEPAGGPHFEISARLDPERGELGGRLTLRFTNGSGGPLTAIPLVLYPNALAAPEDDLDDVTFPHRFPGSFSPGSMAVAEVTVNSVPLAPPGETASSLLQLSLPPGAEIPPGGAVELNLSFRVQIPERYGFFGRLDGRVLMVGGWYPTIPALVAGEGFDLEQPLFPAHYLVDLTVAGPGLLVVGSKAHRLRSGRPVRTEVTTSQPLLLYYLPRFIVAKASSPSGRELWQVAADRRRLESEPGRTLLESSAAALVGGPDEPPFLLLEAGLRESLVMPLPGVVLCSDLAFEVFPLEQLLRQHRDSVRSALFAAALLEKGRADPYEALVAINLLQFHQWDRGEANPLFLRRFFRKAELWGAMDKMGTDPQTCFQNSLFFMPQLPADLERSFAFHLARRPPPRFAARQLYLAAGPQRVAAALQAFRSSGSSPVAELEATLTPEEQERVASALAGEPGDLELVAVRPVAAGGWEADYCTRGRSGELPVELLAASRTGQQMISHSCPDECCTVELPPGQGRPLVWLDPAEIHPQRSESADDPRRNDRNTLDLKWMFNRVYLTMGGGDRLPTMGGELSVQPRYDLRHEFFVMPGLNPDRFSLMAGWRFGLGWQVRPSFLSDSLSLSLRFTTATGSEPGGAAGPAFTWLHFTRRSRMNPFAGNWSYLYLYPLVGWGEAGEGWSARAGGLFSHLWGASPDHVLAVRLSLDTAVGDLPPWERPVTGGIEGLRALGAMTLPAIHRVAGSVEYRFMPVRDIHLSLARLAYITGLQLAFFADAAALSDSPAELFVPGSLYLDCGIGVRPHFDMLGVVPSIFSVDLAWLAPVGGASRDGFNAVISFYQPF